MGRLWRVRHESGKPYRKPQLGRATTNELHFFKRSGGIWGSEQNLGGVISGSPAAAVDGTGTLIVDGEKLASNHG